MKLRDRRAFLYLLFILSCGLGLYLILDVFQSNMMFFVSPTEFWQTPEKFQSKPIRLGGLVQQGSLESSSDLVRKFEITDGQHSVTVSYRGVTPSLFREGKGAVIHGRWDEDQQLFVAIEILAKHDETYTPPKPLVSQESHD